MSTPNVKVIANSDQAFLAWQFQEAIPNCIGFAVYKKHTGESDAVAEPLPNKVGFVGQTHEAGEQRPSTIWPIQRFTWADFTVTKGDRVSYKIVPMLLEGEKLRKDESNASDWTNETTIDTGEQFQAYFNRGIISSQFFSHMRANFDNGTKSVKSIIDGDANEIRDYLGGHLSAELMSILDSIKANPNITVFAALYELQQNDLIEKLAAIGDRAHVVLANGSFKAAGEDKNEASRATLRSGGVEVFDRIVSPNHFGHNKFLVIKEGETLKHVWTGSTNWTPGGLFSQVNNGLYIQDSEDLALAYFSAWEKLRDAGSSSTDPALLEFNATSKPSEEFPHVWFSPKNETGDLNEVAAMMDKAGAILFLMFNPGPNGTLFNKILELQARENAPFIHGVVNQDPGMSSHLVFFHQENSTSANWDEILPQKISEDFGFFSTEQSAGMVTIHSKIVVIDPFSDNATVALGSNNLGPKASTKNDDNLIILKDKKLVEEYAVNILGVYDHYRWRYSLANNASGFKGLSKDNDWMSKYMASGRGDELNSFWFKK